MQKESESRRKAQLIRYLQQSEHLQRIERTVWALIFHSSQRTLPRSLFQILHSLTRITTVLAQAREQLWLASQSTFVTSTIRSRHLLSTKRFLALKMMMSQSRSNVNTIKAWMTPPEAGHLSSMQGMRQATRILGADSTSASTLSTRRCRHRHSLHLLWLQVKALEREELMAQTLLKYRLKGMSSSSMTAKRRRHLRSWKRSERSSVVTLRSLNSAERKELSWPIATTSWSRARGSWTRCPRRRHRPCLTIQRSERTCSETGQPTCINVDSQLISTGHSSTLKICTRKCTRGSKCCLDAERRDEIKLEFLERS